MIYIIGGEITEWSRPCRACGRVHDDGECALPQWLAESLVDMPPEMTQAEIDEMEKKIGDLIGEC